MLSGLSFRSAFVLSINSLILSLFCLSGFSFTNIHNSTDRRGSGKVFNSSLPLPLALQTLRHQLGHYSRELTSAHSQQLAEVQISLEQIQTTHALCVMYNGCSNVYNFSVSVPLQCNTLLVPLEKLVPPLRLWAISFKPIFSAHRGSAYVIWIIMCKSRNQVS